jgi:hypothetical protein
MASENKIATLATFQTSSKTLSSPENGDILPPKLESCEAAAVAQR